MYVISVHHTVSGASGENFSSNIFLSFTLKSESFVVTVG